MADYAQWGRDVRGGLGSLGERIGGTISAGPGLERVADSPGMQFIRGLLAQERGVPETAVPLPDVQTPASIAAMQGKAFGATDMLPTGPVAATPVPLTLAGIAERYMSPTLETGGASMRAGGGGGGSTRALENIMKMQEELYAQQKGIKPPVLQAPNLRKEAEAVYAANPALVRGTPDNTWSLRNALDNFLAHGTVPAMAGKDLTEGLAAAGKVRGDMEERAYQEAVKAREAKIAQQLGLAELGAKDTEAANAISKYGSEFGRANFAALLDNLRGQGATASDIARIRDAATQRALQASQYNTSLRRDDNKILGALRLQDDIAKAQQAGNTDMVKQLTNVYRSIYPAKEVAPSTFEKTSEEELAKYIATQRAEGMPFAAQDIPLLRQGLVPTWNLNDKRYDFEMPAKSTR